MGIIEELLTKEKPREFSELSMTLNGVKIIERIFEKNKSEFLQIQFCKLPNYTSLTQHWCMYQYLNYQLPGLLEIYNITDILSFSGESFSFGKNFWETCFSIDTIGSLEYFIIHSPVKPKDMEGYEKAMRFDGHIYLYKISPFKIAQINFALK